MIPRFHEKTDFLQYDFMSGHSNWIFAKMKTHGFHKKWFLASGTLQVAF